MRADAAEPKLARDSRLGRFTIRALLGAGGMGEVYRAHDPELRREVAIKVLRAELLGPLHAEEQRLRLQREAQAMARLSHPNVVTIYEVGRVDEQIFLVMELVAGATLREWLGERARSWREVIAVFRQAGAGLAAAHAAGLIHRDFKPENVFVGADGRARVGDFGLVGRDRAGDAEPDAALVADVTHTGVHVGTRAGAGRTFQIARTFSRMTARENVLSGALLHDRHVGRARAAATQWLALRQPGPLRRQAFAQHDFKRPDR